jgi:putative protease
VLARELTLAELPRIRAKTNQELEVFAHGALCVSASGLCLISSYLGGMSANRGMCTQACRRLYRRGEEGEQGYYFSPGDLRLLEKTPDLAAAGINALKIEGRMKSADYVGVVVSAYRLVLDAAAEGNEDRIRQSIERGQEILRGDFARNKTAFYFNTDFGIKAAPPVPGFSGIDWLNPAQDGGTGISLGALLKVKGAGDGRRGFVAGENLTDPAPALAAGDSIRLHRADDSGRASHKLTFAEFSGGGYWISIPEGFEPGDRVYLIQTRALSRRYESLIPRSAVNSGRGPGREKAPLPAAWNSPKTSRPAFPEGLYVAVSRADDLYIAQSLRPAGIMLSYTRKSAARLLSDREPENLRVTAPLPFKPAEIILVLDPFFPEAQAETLAEEIERLIEKGYRRFVLNNLGHFSLFRRSGGQPRGENSGVLRIAGPWLYMFNSWSLSFMASRGVDGFVSPLENNRQNLERTLAPNIKGPYPHNGKGLRSMFFIPVFAWPALFRVRADLGTVYDFGAFSDNRGENFFLDSGPEGSRVIPEKPFSITDKIPFLKEAGFGRFIIDLSGPVL